jgi:DNA-binding MarR family transcriptional regulator
LRKEIFAELRLQQLDLLLLVAERHGNGISHTEISKVMGMPQGTVSRNVQKLSLKKVRRSDGEIEPYGYGLVENRIDPFESRQYLVFLTEKGKNLIARLEKILAE